MAAGDRTAVFRAIGDFTRLVRDAKKAKREMGGLGDQTKETGEDLDETGKKADKASSRIVRLSQGAQKLREKLDAVQKSKFGQWMEDSDKRTRSMIGTLTKIAAKVSVLALLGTAATASVGPVLSLVSAVASLAGAVGVVPGIVVAGAAAAGVLKVAFSGMGDAMKAAAGTQEEFNEATKNLPPEMRAVAKAARGLMPALRSIKKSIQAKFWDGLEKPLEKLGSKYLPMARVQGGRLASTFNEMAKELGGFLSEQSSVDDVRGGLENVNKLWQNMIGIVRPLGQVFLDIFAVSSEFLPGMGKGLTDATTKFAAFIRGARESGKLKAWIQTGIDQLKALGSALFNIGRIFGAVFSAGREEGRSFFEVLRDLTDKLADFLESDRGQEGLRKMFKAIGDAIDVVIPILESLFDAVAAILPILVKIGEKVGPGVSAVIRGIQKAVETAEPHLVRLGEALGKFLQALGSAGPMIGQFVGGLADVLTPIVEALTWLVKTLVELFESLPPGMQDAITGFTGMTVVIGLAILAFGKLLKIGAGVLGMVGKLATALNKIPGVNLPVPGKGKGKGGAPDAGGAASKAAGGAADVVDDAAVAAAGNKSGKGFLKSFGEAVKRGAKGVAGAFGSVFSGVSSVAKTAGGGIAKAFNWVKPGIATVIVNIGKGISALATAFRALGLALLTNPITIIITAIALIAYLIITNWDTVKVWIQNFFTWVAGIATWLWQQLTIIFNAIVTAVTTAWNAAWKAVSDAITGIVDGVTAGWNAAWKAVSDALTWIVDGVTGAWNTVWKAVSDAITWIVDGLTTGWNAAWKAVSDALTWIKDGIGSVFGWIGDAVDTVAGVLGDVFGGAFRTAGDVVSSILDGIGSAFESVVGVITDAVDAIKKALSWIGDQAGKVGSWVGDRLSDLNPLNWFHKGGLVGGGGDTPIMAESGEYVVPKKTTAKWLPWLRAINPYDSGGLQMDMGAMLSSVAGSAPTYGSTSSGTSAAGTVASTTGGVRDVHVTQIVNNPLPERPSETASKRTGRAARLGVMSAIGGVA